MMKYLLALGLMFFTLGSTKAQSYDTIPPYQKDSSLPHFILQKMDSSWFNTAQLPKNTAIVITFFNPTCEHCQHRAEALSKKMNKLKNVYFLWATYEGGFQEIADFAKTYHLAGFKNVHFFKDVNFSIPSFYRLNMTPYMAAYSKNGKLLRTWDMGAEPNELIQLYK